MTVQMKQVEDEESKGLLLPLLKRCLQVSETRRAVLPKHYHLTIKKRALHRQRRYRAGDSLHPVRPVQSRTRQQLNPLSIFSRLNTIAVEFELMQPPVTCRRRLRLQCKLRWNEVR